MSLLFIGMGLKIGHKYAETAIIHRVAFLPGILLIVIGLTKMLS
jgi:putative Mn2+ efflux pump MntP